MLNVHTPTTSLSLAGAPLQFLPRDCICCCRRCSALALCSSGLGTNTSRNGCGFSSGSPCSSSSPSPPLGFSSSSSLLCSTRGTTNGLLQSEYFSLNCFYHPRHNHITSAEVAHKPLKFKVHNAEREQIL